MAAFALSRFFALLQSPVEARPTTVKKRPDAAIIRSAEEAVSVTGDDFAVSTRGVIEGCDHAVLFCASGV
jgi:hypothetical protein